MQYITRKGSFDAGHRIMNEHVKCHNLHGHTFLYCLTFSFENIEEIGYQIDFKEIKRIGLQWIDDFIDHGVFLNPCDEILITASKAIRSKYWLMTLNGEDKYCNPSVENIAKIIYMATDILFKQWPFLHLHCVRLYETTNCFTDCFSDSISSKERSNFERLHSPSLIEYAKNKGIFEYDDRK